MKKLLFIVALLNVILFSCKKDHGTQPQPVGKTYTVHFTVNGFSKTTVPFQTNSIELNTITSDSLKSSIDVLYYLVYKNAFRLRKIVQYSSDPDFGTITDSFAMGTTGNPNNYRVVVVAGKTGLTSPSEGTNPNASSDVFEYLSGDTVEYFKDTFYKSLTFTVPDSSYNFTLNRVVAQLKVDIKDAIPANASKISLIFNDYQDILASTALPSPNAIVSTRTVTASVTPGTVNTILSSILLNIGPTFSVEIKCTDAANNILADKTVSGVSCVANETTLLTGNLFSTSGTGFTISYNPAWGPPGGVNF